MVRVNEARMDALRRCDSANAALVLGKSQGTLANWRVKNVGPRWITVGGRVYYFYDDLVAYGMGAANAPQAA